ncbi:MAG: hypothetical protein HY720_32065 [Planctomycetes bacterium]|nr:hypothetical protein [Planctomycetota bacterium]
MKPRTVKAIRRELAAFSLLLIASTGLVATALGKLASETRKVYNDLGCELTPLTRTFLWFGESWPTVAAMSLAVLLGTAWVEWREKPLPANSQVDPDAHELKRSLAAVASWCWHVLLVFVILLVAMTLLGMVAFFLPLVSLEGSGC